MAPHGSPSGQRTAATQKHSCEEIKIVWLLFTNPHFEFAQKPQRQRNALNWEAERNPQGDWMEDGGFMDGVRSRAGSMPGVFSGSKI